MPRRKKDDAETTVPHDTPAHDAKNALNEQQQKLLDMLRRGPTSEEEISAKLGVSKQGVWDLAHSLTLHGYNIRVDNATVSLMGEQRGRSPVIISPKYRVTKIAIISDTRWGSRMAQPRLLATVLEKCRQSGVNILLHAGNVVAGRPSAQYADEFFAHTLDEQIEEVVRYWPRSTEFQQYLLAGQLDLSWSRNGKKNGNGRNILSMIAHQRQENLQDNTDLVVIGAMQRDFLFRGVRVRIMHPVTDRPIYAKSYRPQGIMRNIMTILSSFHRPANDKPDIVIMGGFGVGAALRPRYGIRPFLVPSLIAQSERQTEKEITHEIGFLILTLKYGEGDTLEQVIPEFFNLNPYITPRDNHLVDAEDAECELSEDERRALQELMSGTFISEGELSRRLNLNRQKIRQLLDRLAECGFHTHTVDNAKDIALQRAHRKSYTPLPLTIFDGITTAKIGIVSDTHLNSKWECLEALDEAYRIFDAEKVDAIYHAGDVGDGSGNVGYRGHGNDIKLSGLSDIEDYIVKRYPKSKRRLPDGTLMSTRIIPGNHDCWDLAASGYHIVRQLQSRRRDMVFIGGPEDTSGEDTVKGVNVHLLHPAGGSGYAESYKLQRGIEDLLNYVFLTSEEHKVALPDVLALGNWHYFTFLFYMGVAGFVLPCFKWKDRFHMEHFLTPDVGCVITEITKDEHGNVIRVMPRFIDLSHLVQKQPEAP